MSILNSQSPEKLAEQLHEVAGKLEHGTQSLCLGEFDPQLSTVQLHRDAAWASSGSGHSHASPAKYMSCGLTILRADIETFDNDLVWDTFGLTILTFPDSPPWRMDDVCGHVCDLLDSPDAPLPPVHRSRLSRRSRHQPASMCCRPMLFSTMKHRSLYDPIVLHV